MIAHEVNFDGLVGPTHNYAGLSLGNRASMTNVGRASNPRRAALQGLEKMRTLHRLGLRQGILPPHQRPDPSALEKLGFSPGTTLETVADFSPALVAMLMSASPMWAANAATVSPSFDTADGRIHLTPANLSSTEHRSFEFVQTEQILGTIFSDQQRFQVHRALPGAAGFADEGAANHGRFVASVSASHGEAGVHLFVYGRDATEPTTSAGYPRRQSRLAGELIARSHGLQPARTIFARQSAEVINAGAFHNDVVSVINQNVLFTHEAAFDDQVGLRQALDDAALDINVVRVEADAVPLEDAISSYLFNSQLVTLPDNTMALIAPTDVEETPSTAAYLKAAIADPHHPIGAVYVMDLRESMQNGGGPACLRLRVVMTAEEQAALSGRVIVDDDLLTVLEGWVRRHYRDELRGEDLLDPDLLDETHQALDELTTILELGDLYPFQT